jgi:H+-transporting ATPase
MREGLKERAPTENKLTLGEAQPWAGTDADTLIVMAPLASRAADNDPIDLAILAGLKHQSVLKSYQQELYVPFDPVHKHTEATINWYPSGAVFGCPDPQAGLFWALGH